MNTTQFLANIDRSGDCWLWQRAHNRGGYGAVQYEGCIQQTHRVAWQIAHGRIPVGMWVLHKCDNPACVNPDHLFLGNRFTNRRDCVEKCRATGVGAYGVLNINGKLTDQQVKEIRARYTRGRGVAKLAAEFGVTTATISNIGRGRRRFIEE